MAKAKTIRVEVFSDDEIHTGLPAELKYFPAGTVLEVDEKSAENLIAQRQARKTSSKVNVDFSKSLAEQVQALWKARAAQIEAEEAQEEADG